MDALDDTLKKLELNNGKYVGVDSKCPIHIRINEVHLDNADFKGVRSEYHTKPHFHIERRKNGETGTWKEDFTGLMELFGK